MLEEQFKISKLVTASLQGKLNEVQQAELDVWLARSEENSAFLKSFADEQQVADELRSFDAGDGQATWNKTQALLNQSQSEHRILLWPKIAVAAAAVAAIVFGLWFFNEPHRPQPVSKSAYINDIKPGGNRATIRLADGKVIGLDSTRSRVLVQDSVKTTKIETLVASTPRGGTYSFILPDRTIAYLNAASSIEFPSRFTGKHRSVQIEGEIYFEVAKDKEHPFIVVMKGQQIEVLGTHFNVNSYHDEPGTATTLLEGSVKISAGNVQKVIKPGEQAINRSGMIAVRQIDVENYVDWKNGDFNLNHIEFKTAMRKIARWYDMEIIYDESVPDNMESGGWISRDKPLSTVLKSIESSGLVKFKVRGKKIYVMQ
ncbi:ferric-dicitrate binding protein FerR (iron transport regulator) [Pedobacter sp. AK017]|uniref:FecR family protein n=1 Tax=Pedobacter sp. AK017 TaxID=2723073 RepID=UPI0016218104|nr:FecR family protein [Pedobacter sp. AK017]MBB5441169.1 ferric-dicitrate binding protein FerR (iron transport regulator) [Pedobacter sp. AK017]